MPESPLMNSSQVVDLAIFADGSEIDQSIGVASVVVTSAVNKIPQARVELLDGDMPKQDFPVSNSAAFKPGSEIRIEAGYGQKRDTIFTGIVVRHGLKITGDNDSRLAIECRAPAVKLTVGRSNAAYGQQKDSDVIASLIKKSGLEGEVDATAVEHQELVQYYCSDWDFLLSRAEANGLLVIADGDRLSVKKPDTATPPELKLTYGSDLIELHADLDARWQLARVDSASWDPATQQLLEASATPPSLNQQGDLDAKALADVLGLESYRLQSAGMLAQEDLAGWAEAQQVKSGLARIRGRMKFQGNAGARPGTQIELDGVGEHFNGNVFVGTVTHSIGRGTWTTEAGFGLAPEWFAEQRDLMAPPAAGLLPGVDGLQIGVVTQLDQDPAGEPRIRVKLPLLQADDQGIWARLAGFHASKEFGAFFIPEIDDEVVLGFLGSDPNYPVVLGSLHSSQRKPPYELTADNFTKAIVTRSKLKLEFDDDQQIISLLTPGGNRVVISDADQSILLEDQNGNSVKLDEAGISLDSPGDISLKAQGKIDIGATGAVSIASQADVGVDGMNVNCAAQAGFSAKGNASAELTASGQTTVKGAMVMIN